MTVSLKEYADLAAQVYERQDGRDNVGFGEDQPVSNSVAPPTMEIALRGPKLELNW